MSSSFNSCGLETSPVAVDVLSLIGVRKSSLETCFIHVMSLLCAIYTQTTTLDVTEVADMSK